MKKISVLLAAVCLISSCYDDFTMDYDYTAAYITYQYDLRTFVYGEDNEVGFTVALGGVVDNDRDRKFNVSIENSLLSSDLSVFDETGEKGSFTAMDGMLGTAKLGSLSNAYVTNEMKAAGITALTALPETHYAIDDLDAVKIRKGRHTQDILLHPTAALFADEKALKPCYALGLLINTADADSLLRDRCFEIMAFKVENMFYGNWYHGGRVQIRSDKDGSLVSEDYKSLEIPQTNNNVCALKTTGLNTSVTDKLAHESGSLKLVFNEDMSIDVSDNSGERSISPILGQGSHFNGAKLLQDRVIYLSYSYSNNNGTSTYVTDTLKFRNRMRDGFNEWRSENPEDYE